MELIVVFSTILLSNYFLVAIGLDRDGDGMCLMCATLVVVCVWWCRHGGGMRRRRGRMDECLRCVLLIHYSCWWYCIDVPLWWWLVEVGVLVFPHGDVWWCFCTWGWLLWLLIWCCWLLSNSYFLIRLGEGNLIPEELIFSLHATGWFILSAVVLADKCNFMNDRITSTDHI